MSFAAVASSSVAAVTQTATFLKLKGGLLRCTQVISGMEQGKCMAMFRDFPPKNCGWQPEIRQTHQLRLVVYLSYIFFMGVYTSKRWLFGISEPSIVVHLFGLVI